MEINATIKVINNAESGISQTSGNPWKRQSLVLGWQEPYGTDGRTREQLLLVKLSGRSVDAFAEKGYKQGDTLSGVLDFDTRSYGGKVYNDIALYLK